MSSRLLLLRIAEVQSYIYERTLITVTIIAIAMAAIAIPGELSYSREDALALVLSVVPMPPVPPLPL